MKFDRILLLQQNALGDVVLSTGMVKAFREQFPKSTIAFLADPRFTPLVDLPFIDELIPYTKGMPLWPVIRRLWHYDVAICLDFKYRSAVVPFLARIPVRVGIKHKRKLFLTHYVDCGPENEEMYFSAYLAQVIEQAIGLKVTGDWSYLYVAAATAADRAAVDAVLPNREEGRFRIAVAPFSSTLVKDWPVDYYKRFFAEMEKRYQVEYVLIGGPEEKDRPFSLPKHVVDLRGQLPITATAEALRRSDYFIGSCSAPLHIATAVGLPALAFYGPGSPAKWAPLHRCIHLEHRQSCTPCDAIGYGSTCGGERRCMLSISPAEALAAMEQLMARYPAGASAKKAVG